MNTSTGGCGSGTCQCAGAAAGETAAAAPAAINGIALHAPGQAPDPFTLRELAWGELLRQEAVRQGVLPRHPGLEAPTLSAVERGAIEAMLDAAIDVPEPTAQECERYYEARKSHYVQGRLVHARHILFAVTQGIDVAKLAARAEKALLELSRAGVAPDRFAQLARELSNCPSGADGGDLGWLAQGDCADELANEFFHQKDAPHALGLRPRLVHSRYGLHIIEVLGRQDGRQSPYEEVKERIAVQLTQQSRAKALHQYMQLLAGRSLVEGLDLQGADSPLVQ
jgi:peptidyl-prolyl cis-trans isomerase C